MASAPGVESTAAFSKRVMNVFGAMVEALVKAEITDAVASTHGGIIMTIMTILTACGLPQRGLYEWMSANGHDTLCTHRPACGCATKRRTLCVNCLRAATR